MPIDWTIEVARGPWHGEKPDGAAMESVYDFLRTLTVTELRQINSEAIRQAYLTGSRCQLLLAYQCLETARRWNSGQWQYQDAQKGEEPRHAAQ